MRSHRRDTLAQMRLAMMTLASALMLLNAAAAPGGAWGKLAPYFSPPAEFAGKFGDYRSPLKFEDGAQAKDAKDWARRRAEILHKWLEVMGPWPPLIEKPKLEILERQPRDGYDRCSV